MQETLFFSTILICLGTDLKKRKIYNIVLFPAILLAVLINYVQYGWYGISKSIIGLIFGACLLLIPYIAGGIGAGDVKLLSVVGAINGPEFVLNTFIYMGFAGGCISVLIIFYRGIFFEVIKEVSRGLYIFLSSGLKIWSFRSDREKIMFPYGIAITLGAFTAFALKI